MCALATGPDRPAWAELPLGDGVLWCCDRVWAREHGPGRKGKGRPAGREYRPRRGPVQSGAVLYPLPLLLLALCGSLLSSSVGRKGGQSIGARMGAAVNAFASEGLGGLVEAWRALRPDVCTTHRWTQSSCATRSMLRRTTRYVAEPSSRGAYPCGPARRDFQTRKSMLDRSVLWLHRVRVQSRARENGHALRSRVHAHEDGLPCARL